MSSPAAPHEADPRLAALHASGLLDSPPEKAFDQLTSLASRLLDAPVALISLVDRDRQFFKSHVGLSAALTAARETPLTYSFCQHVVASGEPLVVKDARTHELVADNPAVQEFGVVAYAGVPVTDGRGHLFGAMCAVDVKPREWKDEELSLLRALAAQANTEISLRTLAHEQRDEIRRSHSERLAAVRELTLPLDAFVLTAQALDYVGPLNDAQRECLRLCLHDATTLRGRLEAVLDAEQVASSGADALELAPCPPHYLVTAAVERARPFAEQRQVAMEISLPENLPTLQADAIRLGRVLSQLLTTAIALTARGGALRVTALASPAELAIVIGSGLPPRLTVEPATAGELGLTFSQRITAAHGGRLVEERHADGHRRFTVILPNQG